MGLSQPIHVVFLASCFFLNKISFLDSKIMWHILQRPVVFFPLAMAMDLFFSPGRLTTSKDCIDTVLALNLFSSIGNTCTSCSLFRWWIRWFSKLDTNIVKHSWFTLIIELFPDLCGYRQVNIGTCSHVEIFSLQRNCYVYRGLLVIMII